MIIEKAIKFQENIYCCFIDSTKPLTVWMTTNWKVLKEIGIPDHHTCHLRNCVQVKKQQLELSMEQLTGLKLGKEQVKAVCHPTYLTDDTARVAESEEDLKSLFRRVKQESEKTGLKLSIQKTDIMAVGPITWWQIDGEMMETVTDSFLGLQNHCSWWLKPWN